MIKKQVRRILCAAALAAILSSARVVYARDSQFTRQGSGPMYWITYENQWTKNTYMPEQRLKDNIDWMSKNFLPYGYNMVSTDGWIEGATMLNKNGYILAHNDHWITNPIDMSGAGNSDSSGKLVNGDFENGEAGWQFTGNGMHGVDANDAHNGSKYWMWSIDPHTDSLTQTVKGLANGKYILTAWAKLKLDGDANFSTDGSKAEIRLGEPGKTPVTKAIEPLKDEYGNDWRYTQYEVEADVTNGELQIEFYLDAKGSNTSLQIDDVTLEPAGAVTPTVPIGNQVVNGDFQGNYNETTKTIEGWNFTGTALYGLNDDNGNKSLYTFNPMPHSETVSQAISKLPPGKYRISAKAKIKGNMNTDGSTAVMRIKGYDPSNPNAVDETTIDSMDWKTYTKDIDVTTSSGINLEFYYDAKGYYGGLDLDDVSVEAVQTSAEWKYPEELYPNGHTWKTWVDYAASKGLKFGVYYNPLWVSPEVVKNPDKYTVVGHPDIKVSDLVIKDSNGDPAGGDRFNGGQGSEKSLYWLNVDAPGAEDFIKGYVKYFKDQGVSFLRVDFLSWYESGTDAGIGKVGEAHTREQYEKALKWMSEAAGNDMVLSLVMPNLKDHGELERKYGDMVRIDEDVFGGGWDHTSGRRQTWQGEVWSQWANAFQGLTGFSDISGRGSLIDDADFTRLNTFTGEYANNEKKSEVSLYTISGAPITIADQYDSIGDNYKYYQNSELIELNKLGLSGKPIFNTNAHYKDNKSRDSERWIGQLPDGSWVVGLFNRSDEPKAYTFDFNKELSLANGGYVRDLWAHKDLGLKKTFTITLDPHDCTIIKVIPASQTSRYEAETASYEGAQFNGADFTGGAQFNNNHNGYSGSGFVENLSRPEDKVTFAISVPQEGDYKLSLKYANGGGDASVNLYSRDKVSGNTIGSADVILPTVKDSSGNNTWDVWGSKVQSLKLQKGINLVTVEGKSGNINLDSIELTKGETPAKIVNGDFENGTTAWTKTGDGWWGVDSNDAYQGSKLYNYFPSPGEATISQKITGVADGKYRVTAMVKLMPHLDSTFSTPGSLCEMKVTQPGADPVVKNIVPKVIDPTVRDANKATGKLDADQFAYGQYTLDVDVTGGEMNIEFHTKAAKEDTSLQLDNVSIESLDSNQANKDNNVPLLNSDFSEEFTNWSRNDMVNQSIKKDNDNSYAHISGDQDYNSELWQYAVPGAGTYTLKAKVRSSGNFDEASLYTNYSGGTKKTNIPVSTDWTTIQVPNIQVGANEVIKLGALVKGKAGSSLDIDDVQLTQYNPQDYANVQFPKSINTTNPYTVDGKGVIFNFQGNPKVKIDFVKDDVARVWMEPSGIFQKDKSYVVNNEDAISKPTVTDSGEYIKLQTPKLTVRVYKNPFKIAYYDASNTKLITEESDKGGLGYNGDTAVYENMKMYPDEHFYGLGMDRDTPADLDQRGKKVVMKNNMVSGDKDGNVSDISGTFLSSTKGYGIYFDNTYQNTTFDMGTTDPNNYSFSSPNGELLYYFMNGDNLNNTMKDYSDLTGKAPIPPKWALGYIQSKFGYKSWDEVNNVVDTFRSKHIPVDGIVLDAYWAAQNHYFDFTWSDQFKNPKSALDALAAKGVKVSNIVDPYVQVTSNLFEEGKKKGYFVKDTSGNTIYYDAWYGKAGLIDYTNPEAAKWYTDHAKELRDDGVKGWWIDLNEPETATDPLKDQFNGGNADKIKNVYALEEAKSFYEGQRNYTGDRVWSLSRSGFSGIQEYGTTVWSGDVNATWEAFSHNLELGLSAGMSGIPYFTNDTGGFRQGPPSAELYTRWMQASAFMPVFRAHGDDSANNGAGEREPWQFGPQSETIVTQAIRQRYELLPYIYAAAKQTSEDNTPIMRALASDYTDDSNVSNITDQWMFGSSMMIAPVHEAGATSRNVYLPQGNWYDWNDSTKKYTGKQSINYSAPLDKVPVFVKEGSIIPMGQDVDYVGQKPDDYINLKVYPNSSGEQTKFSLYEDDGNSYSYENNQSATTDITAKKENNTINLNIAAIKGDYQGKVQNRVWAAQVKVDSIGQDIKKVKRNSVVLKRVDFMDKLNAGSDVWYYDSNAKIVYIRSSKLSTAEAQNFGIESSSKNSSDSSQNNVPTKDTGSTQNNANDDNLVTSQRISDDNRYEAAVNVSKIGWKDGSDYVVIVNDQDFADALCATSLAKKYNAPILLTGNNKLSQNTKDEIERLKAKHVVVIGGDKIVSEKIIDSIKNSLKVKPDVKRIFGKDRFETSVKVAEELGNSDKIILINGDDYADELYVSSAAAVKSIPILLTDKDKIPDSVNKFITEKKPSTAYIIGPEDAVNKKVEESVNKLLPSPSIRLAGSNSYDTNLKILKEFENDIKYDNVFLASPYINKNDEFWKALSASALAAKKSAPIILLDKNIPKVTEEYIKDKIKNNSVIIAVGDKKVIPDNIIEKLIDYLKSKNNTQQ
ncbi:MAG: TIM-barrel domain-containing protein [Clostridium sp.]|uniref:TIM-barrel domain-containing protein n=1 Tax=Clostridium sp. TaxID=1506 RepID=UPI0039EAD5BF